MNANSAPLCGTLALYGPDIYGVANAFGGTIEGERLRTRGPARSCGDGPWLTASATPTTVYKDTGGSISLSDPPFSNRKGKTKSGGWHEAYDKIVNFVMSPTLTAYVCWCDGPVIDGIRIGYKYVCEAYQIQASALGINWSEVQDFHVLQSKIRSLFGQTQYRIQNQRKNVWLMIGTTRQKGAWGLAGTSGQLHFKYNELQAFNEMSEFGWFRFDMAGYFSKCYVDAIDSIPQASCNLLANIIETVNAIKGIMETIRHPLQGLLKFAKGHTDPRDLWLTHRYVVTTTKLDIQDYVELNKRLKQLESLCAQNIHCNARVSVGEESYGCQLDIPLMEVLPDNLRSYLKIVGLELSPSNLWDIVPYSFVVDWFADISGILEWYEKLANSLDFHPSHVWFTYMSSYDGQFTHFRVPGRKLDVPPTYIRKEASGRTIRMRIADSISLFT